MDEGGQNLNTERRKHRHGCTPRLSLYLLPARCTFMSRFWTTAELRDLGNWFFTFNGSGDTATSLMCQRVDETFPEFDYAFIFDARKEGVGHVQIQAELKQDSRACWGPGDPRRVNLPGRWG